ncbi:MAG TPA: DUF4394 domain-containing protein [Baekduia sp.]|nr:DUF4394 domain-containing protein [Baekduia sp.]
MLVRLSRGRRVGTLLATVAALVCIGGGGASAALAAPAERAFALSGNQLLTFDPAAPGSATTKTIIGVVAGETLVGIDVRPQNGMLYGLGVNATANTATLYVIGRETGQAGVVGTLSSVAFTTNGVTAVDLPAADYGFDVNPAADRVRVTTASGLNFRINPSTGAPVDGDTGLAPGSVIGINPDGATTSVSGSAYTNDQPNNGNITTLYALSAATDQLSIQNPPNAGTQTLGQNVTVAGTPVNFSAVGGFDIDPAVTTAVSNAPVTSGAGYAVLTIGATTHLYRVSLTDGAATDLGPIGDGSAAIQGLALQRDLDDAGFPVVGLAAGGGGLRRFQTATPGAVTSVALALGPVPAGETMVSLAWRPQTGQLYGLGVDAVADTATLYLVDPQTGAVTVVGAAGDIAYVGADFPPASAGWGIDFNPTVDRLRLVADGGLNARVNPNTGLPVGTSPDSPHNGLPPGSTGVAAVSYTNAFTQPMTGGVTTVYVLEPTANQLLIQNPPNAGVLTAARTVTLGGAPLDFGAVAGLDIPGDVAVATSSAPAAGSGIALLDVSGADGLYALDLTTGAATLLGAVLSPLASIAVGDAQRDLPKPVVPPGPGPDPGPGPLPIPTPIGQPLPGGSTPVTKNPIKSKPKVTKLSVASVKGRKLKITFTTSEAGRATIRLLRELPGRRSGKTCSATRKAGKRCTVRKAYGSITKVVAKSDKVTVTVKGKVNKKALVAGAARVEVTVRDAAGNTSALAAKGVRVRR